MRVGDKFEICGECRVVMIRDELIEITSLGGPRDYAAGERSYELLIRQARTIYGAEGAA